MSYTIKCNFCEYKFGVGHEVTSSNCPKCKNESAVKCKECGYLTRADNSASGYVCYLVRCHLDPAQLNQAERSAVNRIVGGSIPPAGARIV